MTHLILVTTVGLLTAAALSPFTTPPPAGDDARRTTLQAPAFKAKRLTRVEFDTLTAYPDHVLVIDVRRPNQRAAIGGVDAHLGLHASELERRLASIPKDRQIITVANRVSRAGRAADFLASRGFSVAGAIGAQDYEAEGGTVVKLAALAARDGARTPAVR